MRAFYHPDQALHEPQRELHNGRWAAYREQSARVDSVLAAIAPTEIPRELGPAPIVAVHAPDYLEFIRSSHAQWRAAGRRGDALPYVWPVVRRRGLPLSRIDALLGRFSFNSATPITATTWQAAYAAAQTALAAVEAVLDGERAAFALCRPPGHHAGSDYFGGYCYFNNAAIAAQHAVVRTGRKAAILDIDYHHGNGTQDIFWQRSDVFYASLHADPATDYPFYWGYADEVGEGRGAGTTLNLPMPRGTGPAAFQENVRAALDALEAFAPVVLIVSFGADTFEGDPICAFRLHTADYEAIAADIAARGWPTAIILEGGYAVSQLGANVASFLRGFS